MFAGFWSELFCAPANFQWKGNGSVVCDFVCARLSSLAYSRLVAPKTGALRRPAFWRALCNLSQCSRKMDAHREKSMGANSVVGK